MSEFEPTIEFFKEEIQKYDADIKKTSDEKAEYTTKWMDGEVDDEEKDRLDSENKTKELPLKHQLFDMVKQLPEAEKEIATRIDAEIQQGINFLAEFEDEETPVSLDQAVQDAFGYYLDELPMTDKIQAEIDKLREKYGERLV